MLSDKVVLTDAIKALKIIADSEESQTVDLHDVSFITPFLISPITAFIKSDGCDRIIKPDNASARTYLDTIHFPQCIDAGLLDRHDFATYLPLFQFSKGNTKYFDRVIEKIFGRIISLYGLESNKSTVVLFLSELIDNVREHSKSEFNFIYGQKYENMLAISIVDRGITIPRSYEDKDIEFKDDVEALEYTLQGISTKYENERGTGIPNTVSLVCKGLKGSMAIISRGAGFYKAGEEAINFFNLEGMRFRGTVVNILFEIPEKRIDYTKYINKPIA